MFSVNLAETEAEQQKDDERLPVTQVATDSSSLMSKKKSMKLQILIRKGLFSPRVFVIHSSQDAKLQNA